MKVVIMGCGRVGAQLAALLDADGHTITVLDNNASSFQRLPPDFGGTALLIVVGVSIDTIAQIESHMLTRHYEGFLRKGGTRIKGRA